MSWKEVNKEIPEEGLMVLGYHKDWVHPDFNPKGIRECFYNVDVDGLEWVSAIWNNTHDCWETVSYNKMRDDGEFGFKEEQWDPTHWMELPNPPKIYIDCHKCLGKGLYKPDPIGMAWKRCEVCEGCGKIIEISII